jgi:soluble lytic murein transglycosylase-like protein
VARAEEIDLTIIAQIESSGNPLAYNLNSKARGLYQITPICLKDYVQMNDIFYADPDYLFNPAFNTKVANWYFNKRIPQLLKHFNKSVTLENVLWAYNAGIGKVIKGNMPKETKDYIAKYKRLAGAK